jgi:SPP1 family phage portal protein
MFTITKTDQMTSDQIVSAIDHNEQFRDVYNKLESYYLGDHDILNRKKKGTKINNRVVVNHAKFITDINIGYLLGNPVQYQVSTTDEEGDPIYDISPVLDLYKRQTIADLDHEIAKDVSIFGLQYEYLYATPDNEVRCREVDVRNCVLVYDDTMEHDLLFGVLYDFTQDTKKSPRKYTNVLVIDANTIVQYANGSENLARGTETKHFFGEVPIIKYRNNSDEIGDFEAVITLIDAYNIVQSDRINDKQQLVESVLMLKNFEMTADQVRTMKEERVLGGVPENADAKYLEKQSSSAESDTVRSVIESDIHKISMTPNMTDVNFVGNASGVAIKYKLLPFEQATLNKERYFEKGLLQRFKLVNAYLVIRKKMEEVPTHEINIIFKRNLPQNDLETSQMIMNLTGLLPKETLAGQISFVKDAKAEVQTAEEEKVQEVTPPSNNFATDQANADKTNQDAGASTNLSDKTNA